jgi:hypothetical protein
VPDKGRVVTTGVEKGVGQDAEAVLVQMPRGYLSVLVDGLGQLRDGPFFPGQPGGVEGGGAKGVADEVLKEARLCASLGSAGTTASLMFRLSSCFRQACHQRGAVDFGPHGGLLDGQPGDSRCVGGRKPCPVSGKSINQW